MTTKPLPRSIGREATAAPHQARSHCRPASGKKPPPRRLRPGATFDPRTHVFHVHPSCLPSSHRFEFLLFESFQLLDWPVVSDILNIQRARSEIFKLLLPLPGHLAWKAPQTAEFSLPECHLQLTMMLYRADEP